MGTRPKFLMGRAAPMINGVIFLLGAYLFISDGKHFFAMVSLIAAAVNFYLGLHDQAQKSIVPVVLSDLMNFVVAMTIMWDYFSSGKKFIQFAWLLVALVYAVLLIRRIVRWVMDYQSGQKPANPE